jgi:hypothetical protein
MCRNDISLPVEKAFAQFDTLSAWSSRLGVWRVRFPRRLDEVTCGAAALAAHARGRSAGKPSGF